MEAGALCVPCDATGRLSSMTLFCSRCGFTNPPGMRFCGQCGAPLAQPVPSLTHTFSPEQLGVMMGSDLLERFQRAGLEAAGQRRDVTVLFADLAGYSSLTERLDPEDLFDLLRRVLHVLANAVYRYEGAVDKFTGDGLMALFGAPIAQENNVERALRCAGDMQADLAQFLRGRQVPQATDVRLHVGLHSGPVIVGSLGSNLLMNYTAIGDTVNLARRIQEASPPGTVLASARVWRQARALFDFEAVAPLHLKGISLPVSAYRLVGTRARADAVRGLPGLRAPMIGRSGEMSILAEAVETLVSHKLGRFVLVTGEAGLGKSRLVSELIAIIDHRAVRVWEGHSLTYRRSTAYWMFADLLRNGLGMQHAADEAGLYRRLEERLALAMPAESAQALPYLAHLLAGGQLGQRLAAGTHALDADRLRQQTFQAVREFIVAEAQCQPLVLVLEDLHWADEVSLDLLQALLDVVGHAPVVIMALSRPAIEGALAELGEHARQRLGEHFSHLILEPLAPGESQELLGQLLAVPLLPEALLVQILDRAAGVPLFLEEILRMLIDAGVLGREADTGRWRVTSGAPVLALRVPDTLQALILTRFDRLNEIQRRTLQVAAVIGRQFGRPMLLAVLTQLGWSATEAPQPASLAEALDQLARREFILPLEAPGEQEYAFKHSLVSDAIYSTLLRDDRQALHGLVGAALEKLQADRLEAYAEELARHFGNSSRQERALPYLILAGQKAARGHAVEPARGYFEQALALLPEGGQPADAALDAHTGLGQVLLFAGEYQAARQQFVAALSVLASGLTQAADRQARHSKLDRLLSRVEERQGNHEAALQRLAAAKIALASAHPPQPVAVAQVLHDIGWIHFRCGRRELAQAFLEEALALAIEEPAHDVIASIYNRLGGLAYSQGDWTQSASYVRKSIALRETIGDNVSLADSFNNLGVLEIEMGQYDSALENLGSCLALKRRQGQAEGIAVALNNLGLLRVRRGELAEARAALAEAWTIAQQIGYSSLQASVLMHTGELHLAAREWPAAQAALERGASLFSELGVRDQLLEMYRLLGEVALGLGNVRAAGQWQALATPLLAALSEPAPRLSTLQHGEYERFRGRLALYRGEWALAQQLLRASAEIHGAHGNRFYQGRIAFDLGLLAERQGDNQRAQLQYREASLLFSSVGARLDTEWADAAVGAAARR